MKNFVKNIKLENLWIVTSFLVFLFHKIGRTGIIPSPMEKRLQKYEHAAWALSTDADTQGPTPKKLVSPNFLHNEQIDSFNFAHILHNEQIDPFNFAHILHKRGIGTHSRFLHVKNELCSLLSHSSSPLLGTSKPKCFSYWKFPVSNNLLRNFYGFKKI